nr:tRNA pseudouridine(38-40) synthase TruA [Desulfoprunum benzoelyticum]
MLIAFDGTGYSGWQRQKHGITIQGEIESRLFRMTGEPVSLHGAGRTDAGVHADGMVANFHTAAEIPCPAFFQGLNSMLPPAIRILCVDEVQPDFHARFAATGKQYIYRLFTGTVLMPQQRHFCLHYPAAIDFQAIQACLTLLTGTHDFASFENTGSRDKSLTEGQGSTRTLFAAGLEQTNDNEHLFSFTGNGFLRQMVRNLVGTLLEVGRGKQSVDSFERILLAKDRTAAGPTAPAHGLTLKKVFY